MELPVGRLDDGRYLYQCEKNHYFALVRTSNVFCRYCRKRRRRRQGSSRGEDAVVSTLNSLRIPFEREVVKSWLPGRRYDFEFTHEGRNYLLEFDGQQHFEFCKAITRSRRKYAKQQEADRIKTRVGIRLGYRVIRIDYNEIGRIRDHLLKAFAESGSLYVSSQELYFGWLLNVEPNNERLRKEAPYLFLNELLIY